VQFSPRGNPLAKAVASFLNPATRLNSVKQPLLEGRNQMHLSTILQKMASEENKGRELGG
jgi:hypothetical protein